MIMRKYTGLVDKNGRKIFEGDIVRHENGTLSEVVLECRNGLEAWYFGGGLLRQLEVVGNIYDNPELLDEDR